MILLALALVVALLNLVLMAAGILEADAPNLLATGFAITLSIVLLAATLPRRRR